MSIRQLLFDDISGKAKRGDVAGSFSNLPLTSIATANGETVLSSTSTTAQRFTGTNAHTVKLPDATTLLHGKPFIIQNRSTDEITVKFSDDSTAFVLTPSSDQWFVVVNTDAANGWDTGPVNQYETLQDQINAILEDTAQEIVFTVSGSNTDFDVSGHFSFDPSNLVRDIIVYRNVSRQYLSPTGLIADGHYKKLDSTSIQFLYAMQDGDKVVIRKERTGGGLDLRNIGVDPRPAISGGQSLGDSERLWSGVFVKDMESGLPYEIGVSGGVLVALPS